MNAFIVQGKNQPGELARVTEAIAAKGINLITGAVASVGSEGSVVLLTNDEAGTRSALQGAGFSFREIEATAVGIADKPGALAQAARKLADAGINIEAALATGMSGGNVTVAFATSDPARAREILGQAVGAKA